MNFFKMIKIESVEDLKDLAVNKEKETSLYDAVPLQKLVVLKYLLERIDESPVNNSRLFVMRDTEEEKYLDFYLEFNSGEYEVVCFDSYWSDDEDFFTYLKYQEVV